MSDEARIAAIQAGHDAHRQRCNGDNCDWYDCTTVGELLAALAEAQRERDALICGITDLLHEISGDDYLAGSSLPLPALAAVVRRQVAALTEARRALDAAWKLIHFYSDCDACRDLRERVADSGSGSGTLCDLHMNAYNALYDAARPAPDGEPR